MIPGRIAALLGAIVVAVGVGLGSWYWYGHREAAAVPPAPAVTVPSASADAGADAGAARHPIAVDPSVTLPTLAESDGPFIDAVTGITGLHSAARLFVPGNHIRNIVATVDALTRERVSRNVFPFEPVPGKFRTERQGGKDVFGAFNARRYDAIVRMIAAVPPEQAAAAYRHFYPLFQQAYRELGYPDGYFNDRLVEVIDDLVQTPDLGFPIVVVRPSVTWQYADPELESLPAGQKMLLRLGPENVSIVVQQLKAFRRLIAATG